MADEAKAKGNATFSAGKFEEAIGYFVEAIALSPDNHVLYSNHSAAYASLHKYEDALKDAKKTVELKSNWAKGYSHLGAAYVGLGQLDEAIGSYKQEALQEKEYGDAVYKKKEFESAVQHYSRAIELDDEDISYITNRAAVYLEMGKYEESIVDCDKAVEKGRLQHADYKMIVKALTRKGTAYTKMAKNSKDYEPAIEAFKKALTEHRNPDTLKKLNDDERAKKDLEHQEYYDPAIANEEKEKGSDFFKQGQYPEAVKYSDAIKRNPADAKAFSLQPNSYYHVGELY
ncbi:unnamed protein product [Sphagnum compactum]